jgi:GR25 family glycosyltransferase involved in LPS biosynthesis
LLDDVLAQEGTIEKVEKRLWIRELKNDIQDWFHTQMATMFWDAILEIIATVHGHVDGQQTLTNIENNDSRRSRIVVNLIGDAQWIQLWNEALSAALPAARDAVRGKGSTLTFRSPTQLHNELFDTAFSAGSSAALAAAQAVVERTQPAQNNAKRNQMWTTIWSVWDDMWRVANERTRSAVVPIVEEVIEEIVTLVTDEVIASIQGSQAQNVQLWVTYNVS